MIAIDPGTTESAFVLYEDGKIVSSGKVENNILLTLLSGYRSSQSVLAIEMIASYGMTVGQEVFETCVWIGRFTQLWQGVVTRLYRRDVKLHLCGQARAKDANVRQALIDRFGGRSTALGTKRAPGPLYGVSGDVWQALAVAVTYQDTLQGGSV